MSEADSIVANASEVEDYSTDGIAWIGLRENNGWYQIRMALVDDNGWVLVDARSMIYIEMIDVNINHGMPRLQEGQEAQNNYVDIMTLNVEHVNDRGYFHGL